MEINLTKTEAETIILEAINAKFPGMNFNCVEIHTGYHGPFCEISKGEPVQALEQEAA